MAVVGLDVAHRVAVLEDDHIVGARQIVQVEFGPVAALAGVGHPEVPVVVGIVVPWIMIDQTVEQFLAQQPQQPGMARAVLG